MKKLLLSTSALLMFFFPVANVLGHHTEETGSETDPDYNISLSKDTILIDETDLGRSYEISITNKSSEPIALSPIEKRAEMDSGGDFKLLAREARENFLDFPSATIVIPGNSEALLSVRIKLNVEKQKNFPALVFQQGETPSGNEEFIVFLIQDFEGALDVTTAINVGTANIVYTPNLKLALEIANTGSKFFTPTGKVKISKNSELLFEQEIDAQDILFANDKIDFTYEWENTSKGIAALGVYEVEVDIQPEPFTDTEVTKIVFVYIPQEVILAGAAIIIVLVAGLLIFKLIKRKGKKESVESFEDDEFTEETELEDENDVEKL